MDFHCPRRQYAEQNGTYVKTGLITVMKWNHDIVQMMCFQMVAKVTAISQLMHDVQSIGMTR